MQNSSSVPPKDQGESNIPSGTTQSGKSSQSKSQFRTIAPKIVPKVLTSRVLPCPSSLSDQVSLAPPLTSKPLGMPTQNYALMQVAGQEGTFSLVALPSVTSAQPVQKPRTALPENLKLPIPRYQPPRSNKGLRKKWGLSSLKSDCTKPPPDPAQTCQMIPCPPAHPELPHKPSPLKQMPTLDPAPASIHTATLTSGQGDSHPLVTNSHGDLDPPATPACSAEEPSATQSLSGVLQKASCASKEVTTKPAVASEELKEQVDPAIFSSAVPLVSLAPKGKLAILPSSRVKITETDKPESDADIVESSSSKLGANHDERSPITEGFSTPTKMTRKIPTPQDSKHSESFCSITKLDLSHKAKLGSRAAKRTGRKRKASDEILAFQGRKKKCINICGDGKERARNSPQELRDQKPLAARKYRSIMPKPVIVMSALAPLAPPAAVLQAQTPSSLAQDVLPSNTLSSKRLGPKLNDYPAPKPSSALRNGFGGFKKPWHRCPVCNHHFQFKQHLLDHMNMHTNRQPYSCRICRKAYVRPGSLSAHMKLHHCDNRPKKLVCCEFCAKVFGHVQVYFGHLKEVHRVVISTEPSPSEPQPGDMPKSRNRDAGVQGPTNPLERESKSSLEEDFLLNQADEVKLQIRCGRCQITAQSFAEIKFHLLHVHGEEIQGRLQEVILPGSRVTAPDQKRRPEKSCASVEDPQAFPKLKGQFPHLQQSKGEAEVENEAGQLGMNGLQGPVCPGPPLWTHSGFNCLLCAQTLGQKEDLLLHWGLRHNCEDPARLWAILSAFFNGTPELYSQARH
uniref:Zinc finger protein 438 n=1 Tax=Nannospalax galili TaxID=1026970 RepID=A0A8C6R267_NANGA